jgi:CHAT domain-containing protein
MGRLQDAVYSFEEVIDLRKRTLGTNHPNYANAVNNLALVEFVLGMYPEAEKHLLECKEIYKKTLGEKDKFYANSINNLASVFKAQGKLSQAEETYKECLRIYKEGYGDSTDKYAIYLGVLAGTYRMMKRYKDAIALTLRSLAILRSKLGVYHYDHVETEYNLAETYREAGLIPEAKKHYLHSMQGFLILIDKYFPYLSEKDKTSFYYNVANAFETFNSFIISLQQQFPTQDHSLLLEKMYNNQVALKSLLLKESEKIRSAISKTTDVLILEKYRQWLQLRETIVQHYRLSTEDQVAKGVNLPGLEKEANELEQSIGIALNVTDKKEPIVSWKEIRDRLQPGEFAVEMIRTDYYNDARWTDTVYYSALIIQKNSEKPSIVIIPGNDLENKNLGNYRKALKAKLGDDLSYIAFWEPLLKSLAGARRIYFSPDGVYQQLNLYTLKDPRSGKYLVDASDLRLVTNTKDILVSGIANTSRKAIIFSNPDFGKTKNSTNAGTNRVTGFPELDDLPGTKMESDSIKKILAQFAWTINEHSRKNATEEAVKRISKPTVLHIATHGYFLKNIKENEGKVMGIQSGIARQNPLLRSGVILAGAAILATDTTAAANADDGILTAYEAAGLDLSTTELVVLSACETGLGEILNGQGVYGLQRAFMVAGARSVIMSLWKIDDLATQQLMVYFYKAWQEDKEGGKQKALRTAQQKLREKYPHPFYWGAFVIVGSL